MTLYNFFYSLRSVEPHTDFYERHDGMIRDRKTGDCPICAVYRHVMDVDWLPDDVNKYFEQIAGTLNIGRSTANHIARASDAKKDHLDTDLTKIRETMEKILNVQRYNRTSTRRTEETKART